MYRTMFFVIIFCVLFPFEVIAQNDNYESVFLTNNPLSVSADGNGKVCVGEILGVKKQIIRYDRKGVSEVLVDEADPVLSGLTLFNGDVRHSFDRYNAVACDKDRLLFFGFLPQKEPNLLQKVFGQPIRAILRYNDPVTIVQLPENTTSTPILNDVVILYGQSGHWFIFTYLSSLGIPGWLEIDPKTGIAQNLVPSSFAKEQDMSTISTGCFTKNSFWSTFTKKNNDIGLFRRDKTGKVDLLLSGSGSIQSGNGNYNGVACNETDAVMAIKDAQGYKFITFKEGSTLGTTTSLSAIDGIPMSDNESHQLTTSGDLLFTMNGSLFMISGGRGRLLKAGTTTPAGNIVQVTVSGTEIFYRASSGGFAGTKLYAFKPKETPVVSQTEIITAVTDLNGVVGPASPGKLMTLYGQNLCSVRLPIPIISPFPVVVNGVLRDDSTSGCKVLVDGTPVGLYFAWTSSVDGSSQMNFLVPYGITAGNHELVVQKTEINNGTTSVIATSKLFALKVEDVNPTFFKPHDYSVTLSAPPYVTEGGELVYVSPTHPAHPGDVLVAYLSGGGKTSPMLPERNAGTAQFFQPIQVWVNDIACPVYYAGTQNQYPGLEQINFQIPSGVMKKVGGMAILKIEVGASKKEFMINFE